MVRDAVRSYLDLASGFGTLTQRRALAAARAMVSGGGVTADQVASLADDLLATSRANREAVAGLVRVEVERALGRLGLATAEDVRALTARLAAVESAARTAGVRATARPQSASTSAAPAKKATKRTTKKASASRSAAPAKKATKRTTKKASGSTSAAPAKKTAKPAAKKAAASTSAAPAKKAAAQRAGAGTTPKAGS